MLDNQAEIGYYNNVNKRGTKKFHKRKKEVKIMANKITKRTVINAMLADANIKGNEMYVNYLTHELELLDNKRENKKPTKTQKANEPLKLQILETLAKFPEGLTASDVLKNGGFDADISNQKISALLKQLSDAHEIVRTVGKRTIFTLPVAETKEN